MSRWWLMAAWLIYFVSPIDLLPDYIPLLGRLEDVLLLVAGWYFLRHGKAKLWESLQHPRARQGRGPDRRSSDARNEPREDGKRNPYEILGVSPSASVEEIRHAYRLQAGRYHPDKVAHLGEEFQQLAHRKFQDIQWAYEELTKP